MSFKKLSVLVPTRYRAEQVRRLVKSFQETTQGIRDSVEMIFRVDIDDNASPAVLDELQQQVVIGPRMRGYRSLSDFFTELARTATGDLLMAGNDDMVFLTKGWPLLAIAEANKYPDGLFNIGCAVFNADHFPFPIISRTAFEQLGHFFHSDIYWGDVYLRDVFAGIGRCISLPSIEIEHAWMGRCPDQVFFDAKQHEMFHNDEYWQLHGRLVQESIVKLKGRAA